MSMFRYVLKKQEEEIWEKKKFEYLRTNSTGFLHKKKKKREKTAFDEFKKVKFSLNEEDNILLTFHGVSNDINNFTIWEAIQNCTRLKHLDLLYDYLYPLYSSGALSSDQWHVFENLAEHRDFSTPNNNS